MDQDESKNPESESIEQVASEAVEAKEAPSMMGALKTIAFALLLFAVAYYFYITMAKYENGESIRMNRILLFAYKALGKNVTVIILGLFGAFLAFSGIKELIQVKSEK